MENMIGQRIDSYLIDAELGSGGMGIVYRAIETKSQQVVAIKLMHPHLARRSDFRARFFREADIVLELKHPAIVPVQSFTRNKDRLYIVMDYIEGGSLAHYLRQMQQQGQLVRLRETLLIIAQIAEALDFAHSKGVHHRDIKPDNILLQLQQMGSQTIPVKTYVADFGLAKIREGDHETKTGSLLGTPAYLSPEYCSGKPIDGRSDLYSLGIVLYQLTTGRVPFQATSILEGCEQHRTQQPPAPRSLHPGLPENVAALITKGIAKYPHDRFQSGAEMAQALRDIANQLSDAEVIHFPSGKSAISLVTLLQSSPFPIKPTQVGFDELPKSSSHDQLIISRNKFDPLGQDLDKNKPTYTIGRARSNDIILNGSKVSRTHAILQPYGTGWAIIDQNSANGTLLEGQKLQPGILTPWQPNTTLIIDSFFLHWRPAGQSGTAPNLAGYAQTEFTQIEETELYVPTEPGRNVPLRDDRTKTSAPQHADLDTAVEPQPQTRAKWPWILGGIFSLVAVLCVGTLAFYCSTASCDLTSLIFPTPTEEVREIVVQPSATATPTLLPTETSTATPEPPTKVPPTNTPTPTPTLSVPATVQRLQFESGSTSDTVTTTLIPGVPKGYILRVQAGQEMFITLNRPANVVVLNPNGTRLPPSSSTINNQWQVVIPQTGDYTVVIGGEGETIITFFIPPS